MIFFLKHIHHRLTDLLNNGLPGFLIPSDVAKGFHLNPFAAQPHLDGKAIDPLEILFLAFKSDVAGLGKLFSFFGKVG